VMQADWGAPANAPPGCPECAAGWDRYVPYLARGHAERRFAVVSGETDAQISSYFGIPAERLAQGLGELASTVAAFENVRIYYVQSASHVWLGRTFMSTRSASVRLPEFIGEELDGAVAWPNVRP